MADLYKIDSAFFIDVVVDGKEQKTLGALIDTGSSTTHINNETCLKNELKFIGSRGGGICIHGVVHKDLKIPMYEASISVADVKFEKLRVTGLNKDVTHNSTTIDVVIGRDILKKFVLNLDWKQCKGEINS